MYPFKIKQLYPANKGVISATVFSVYIAKVYPWLYRYRLHAL